MRGVPPEEAAPEGAGGRAYGWATALALAVPLAVVAAATGYAGWRRLAGKDKGHL